jgi:hypothetical protein
MSNKRRTTLAGALWLGLATVVAPHQALSQAQVGHDPEHSPYRDLRATHQFTLSAGYLAGGGGQAGVGPKQGPLAGLRYSLSLGAVEVNLGAHAADLDRHVMSPTAAPDQRALGVASQSMFLVDGGFTLRVTGAKTWHGLMPYVGMTLGAAIGGAVPADTSGFRFGNQFQWGPHLGVRFYGPGSLSLWVEGWDPQWRLKYPNVFASGATPLITIGSKEWVHNPALLVGFSVTPWH